MQPSNFNVNSSVKILISNLGQRKRIRVNLIQNITIFFHLGDYLYFRNNISKYLWSSVTVTDRGKIPLLFLAETDSQ